MSQADKDLGAEIYREIDWILQNRRDTTPERIRENRMRMLPYLKKIEKVAHKEAKDTFLNWFHYFTPGYESPVSIDELCGSGRFRDKPGKLREAIADLEVNG